MPGIVQMFIYAGAIVLAEKIVERMTGWRDGRVTIFVISAGVLAVILVRN